MEQFNFNPVTPEVPAEQPEQKESNHSLNSLRKAGKWFKGMMAAAMISGAAGSAHAEAGAASPESNESDEHVKFSLLVENPFESGKAEMKEASRESFVTDVTAFFEGMTREEAIEFAKNPNIILRSGSSSDQTPFRAGARIETSYGIATSNEQLALFRAQGVEDAVVSALSSIDNPSLDDAEDALFSEAIKNKVRETETPPRGVMTDAMVRAEHANETLTDAEVREKARTASFEVVEISGEESNMEIAEDIGKYKHYHFIADKSGSMISKLEDINNKIRTISPDTHVTFQGFTEELEGAPEDVVSVEDMKARVSAIAETAPRREVQEQATASLLEALRAIPDSDNPAETHCLRVVTDEYLRDITLAQTDEIIALSAEKNADVKISVYDNKASAFRTITPFQLKAMLAEKLPDAAPDTKLRFNVNGGRTFADYMQEEGNYTRSLAGNND